MDLQSNLALVAATFSSGIMPLVTQMGTTVALFALGVWLYKLITYYDERRLIDEGNVAAAVMLAGSTLALAIPLAATLATQNSWVDILIWGSVALVVQLAFFSALYFLRKVGPQIVAGNVAAAIGVVGAQIAFSLLNAAAMAGNVDADISISLLNAAAMAG